MKELIWKELREQRYIPLAYGALIAALISIWYAGSAWMYAHHEINAMLTATDTAPIAMLVCCIAGVFPAAGAVAPEIGAGTLGFLNSLPAGRARVWLSKVIAGAIVTALSFIVVMLVDAVVLVALFGWKSAHTQFLFGNTNDGHQLLTASIGYAFYGYAATLLVSCLVDRAVIAAFLGLIVALGVYLLAGGWMSELQIRGGDGTTLIMSILAMLTSTFLLASFVTFMHRDFRALRPRLLRASGVVVAGLFVTGIVMFMVAAGS